MKKGLIMATGTYGKNFTVNGAPASAGTDQTRQDRPNEGLPGVATTGNTNADGTVTNPTRGNFDTGKAIGYVSRQVATIDTSGTSGNSLSSDVKRGYPSKW